MDWRIYYANGTTFDSSQGAPTDASSAGCICILQRDLVSPFEVEPLKGENYYFWGGPSMQWRGACRDAVIEALLEGETIIGLIQGRRMSRVDFFAMCAQANADPDFQ